MKKISALILSLVLLVAFVTAPVTSMAGSCGSHGKAKTADAHKASAKCSAEETKACAERLGLSVDECQKLCSVEGHQMVSLSIEGMTCTGCETSISSTLAEIPGVMHVGKVSHKDGSAFVIVDSKKVESSVLAKTVTKKGYKAEVVPAVAVTSAAGAKMVDSKAGCGQMAKKTCAKTCAKPCTGKDKSKVGAKTDKLEGTE